MARPDWERQYVAGLLTSNKKKIQGYEQLRFFSSIAGESHSAVQELLLHRLIAQLENVSDALVLLDTVRRTGWDSYAPRVLAKIADTEAVLRDRPELADYFKRLRESRGYTTYSIKDWCLIGDGTNVRISGAPVWTRNIEHIADILYESDLNRIQIDDIIALMAHYFDNDIRIFQLAVLTFSSEHERWAEILHRVLAAPYIVMDAEQSQKADTFTETSPANVWAPHWNITLEADHQDRWRIYEQHTAQHLHGLGSEKIFDQISVLLALSGLLREGIQLAPLDGGLVRALIPSHPIWGFRQREFSAARTSYQAEDVRALALGFLEQLPASRRVTEFRSRLALHFVSRSWPTRKSASVTTAENGFYKQVIRGAQLLDENRFRDVLAYIKDNPHRSEPVFEFFRSEAEAALGLFATLDNLPDKVTSTTVSAPEGILCVTHASVPDQTGGYAIRAHGILRSLREHGINISAVTRPGFPSGTLTQPTSVVVDDVEYQRLSDTGVNRSHGEIKYLMSFVEPFRQVFEERGIATVHVRSTFLIALPALIAARQLGLQVLYEVSGLWELVYQDREHESNLLKRSPFAELAETITMTNADQLVVMNEAVRQIAIDRGVAAEKIHIAHNAVNVDNFVPMESEPHETFTIGYLGSFADYEGLDDLVDVVHQLRTQGEAVHALMVGDGLRFNHIRSRIINEGLEEFFTLTGRVPHEQVMEQYKLMDVLVYPRISTGATETITPLKPFEALALAKPIIVSDVAPLKEIVGNDERGIVFESGNVQDFARAIRELSVDSSLRTALGDAGRHWVVENRNWENVVETFVKAYEHMH
ncbi:hypothetical protein GCM10009720_27370 [Yaniella flava]|uniref:D-inositol 3-phosphate glycosyltransferase n=1 Tax=Yaniella flava TaxID=287930 RepID=A0ABN2UXQ9_9MICC